MKVEYIYVELDCLLDTRLGTVARINPDIAEKLLENDYTKRRSDVFEGIALAEYKEAYANRDVDTLLRSAPTACLNLFHHLIEGVEKNPGIQPERTKKELIVNCYPYDLTHPEQEELVNCIAVWIQNLIPVSLIHRKMEDCSPAFFKGVYSQLLMYNFSQWMEYHAPSFENYKMPTVTCFTPQVFIDKNPTDEELDKITKESADPFRATEFCACVYLELKFIDVKYFSILEP